MLNNYLKIALRNIISQRIFSAINVLGLAVGFACSLLIALFVIDETSYDKEFSQSDRIYRVSRYFNARNGNPAMSGPANAPQVAPLLKENYPAVEETARLIDEQVLVSNGDRAFYEPGFRLADNSFFRIFDFDWIQGDPATALLDPFSVVLTESSARKYFAETDPIGQTLLIENAAPMQVTGVIRDLPHNTHLTADIIASLNSIPRIYGDAELQSWGSNNYHTYVLLRKGERIRDLESQFPDFFERFYMEGSSDRTGMTAIRLEDIHLRGGPSPFSTPGDINTVYVLVAIAVCILLIGSINFMNLSTARAGRRAKEVGMRVSLGASRVQIVRQFLGESLLFALLAMVMALALVELMLPWFNNFVNKDMSLGEFTTPLMMAGVLSVVLVVGVLAGSYPAFYISAFQPAKALKGDMSRSRGGILFRNCLVVLQFAISIALVISTSVVFSQMHFARNIELGFAKDRIVILTGSPTERLGAQWRTIRNRLLEHPGISHVTASKRIPGEQNLDATGFRFQGQDRTISMPFNPVDYDFFATYGVNLVAGRTFDENIVSDALAPPREGQINSQGAFVINVAAARVNGWSAQEAIGKSVEFAGNAGAVVGVIEDVYFESLRNQIRPMVYFLASPQAPDAIRPRAASIKVSQGRVEETLAYIDSVWNEYMPDYPVVRRFLETDFEVLYQNEEKQGAILGYFSLLAIAIACFGLYGLASLNAQQRTKEIGVRKVMGGSVWNIVLLLTNDFSKLVLLSNLIAWPVAWYAMNQWLANFAYRIDLTPLIFIGSGLIALCIAWVTVGGTAAKAASQRPVLALRYE